MAYPLQNQVVKVKTPHGYGLTLVVKDLGAFVLVDEHNAPVISLTREETDVLTAKLFEALGMQRDQQREN